MRIGRVLDTAGCTIESMTRTVAKHIGSHAQRSQTVGESINAGSRLCGSMSVGPYNIESRIYMRDRKIMECGVGKCQRGQIVGVCNLKYRLLAGRQEDAIFLITCLFDNLFQHVHW